MPGKRGLFSHRHCKNTGLARGSSWVLLPLTQAPVRPRKWAEPLHPAQLPAPGAAGGHSCCITVCTLP